MKQRLNTGTFMVLLLALAGCASLSILEELLAESLPPNAQITMTKTCTPLMGPAVALLSSVSRPSEELILNHAVDGLWVRENSLSAFVAADAEVHVGLGLAGTILDGKKCLRGMTEKANEILFGTMEGLYFRSNNRQIVIILFDEPPDFGVLFVQAP